MDHEPVIEEAVAVPHARKRAFELIKEIGALDEEMLSKTTALIEISASVSQEEADIIEREYQMMLAVRKLRNNAQQMVRQAKVVEAVRSEPYCGCSHKLSRHADDYGSCGVSGCDCRSFHGGHKQIGLPLKED